MIRGLVSPNRVDQIRMRLESGIQAESLEVIDESHFHVGHAGAQDGRGHFRVRIVAEVFTGLPTLARHRRIYRALGDLMQTDIHALSIEAISPNDL